MLFPFFYLDNFYSLEVYIYLVMWSFYIFVLFVYWFLFVFWKFCRNRVTWCKIFSKYCLTNENSFHVFLLWKRVLVEFFFVLKIKWPNRLHKILFHNPRFDGCEFLQRRIKQTIKIFISFYWSVITGGSALTRLRDIECSPFWQKDIRGR